MKEILVCIDGSEHALKALQYAVDIANKSEASLTVLEVVEVFGTSNIYFGYPGYYNIPVTSEDHLEKIANERLEKLLAPLGELKGSFHRKIAKGDPAVEIIEVIESGKFDLVILGTHGRGALGRFLLGSVSSKVVHHSKAPVMVIR